MIYDVKKMDTSDEFDLMLQEESCILSDELWPAVPDISSLLID